MKVKSLVKKWIPKVYWSKHYKNNLKEVIGYNMKGEIKYGFFYWRDRPHNPINFTNLLLEVVDDSDNIYTIVEVL